MNVNTGDLFRLTEEEQRVMFGSVGGENNTGTLQKMRELERMESEKFKLAEIEAIIPVPTEFAEEANRLLGDQDRVFVDMEKDTPLVDWAKAQRNQPHPDGNRKHRRKMAKESRQKNRR